MQTDAFDYQLPEDRIAQQSVEPRDHAKMLCVDRTTGSLDDKYVYDLPSLLEPGDLVVFNDTKVFKARFEAVKESGGVIEVFFLRQVEGKRWEVLAKRAKRLLMGDILELRGGWQVKVVAKDWHKGTVTIELPEEAPEFFAYSDTHGEVPTPPYVTASEETQRNYQTAYAKHVGSVAAPTAGFHFTPALLEQLKEKGIRSAFVTLHVGIGTFRPMKDGTLEQHVMHEEWGHVPAETVEAIRATKAQGKKVIAIGTTATRALESAGRTGTIEAWSGYTSLFITPGYQFNVIDGLLTNFHLPKSTLIVLVSSFSSIEIVKAAYQYAIEHEYRFYSFGDAMLVK